MPIIEHLTEDRVLWLSDEFARLDGPKSAGYFERCFAEQARGERVILVARDGDQLHGYCHVVWSPAYTRFREQGIPEIQDLNVVPASRRQGVASGLMDAAEALIAERGPIAGIGVGLHPGYGPAQRMYALRGYVPDARPVTYHNEFVTEGQAVKLDDELVMHLTKRVG